MADEIWTVDTVEKAKKFDKSHVYPINDRDSALVAKGFMKAHTKSQEVIRKLVDYIEWQNDELARLVSTKEKENFAIKEAKEFLEDR